MTVLEERLVQAHAAAVRGLARRLPPDKGGVQLPGAELEAGRVVAQVPRALLEGRGEGDLGPRDLAADPSPRPPATAARLSLVRFPHPARREIPICRFEQRTSSPLIRKQLRGPGTKEQGPASLGKAVGSKEAPRGTQG